MNYYIKCKVLSHYKTSGPEFSGLKFIHHTSSPEGHVGTANQDVNVH